jgi:formylglycine-generating enzyme required for sulfatase activity
LARREERLAKLAEARAKLEARAKERFEREMAEHRAKLAARDEKTAASGKKPGGRPPAPPLERHFDTVEVVKDLKIQPLRQKLNGFLRSYGNDPDARLFIYYAGHGYTEPILQYNEYRGYITGIDTPGLDGSQRALDAARPNAMSMMEIRVPLAEVLAKHILIVFDSCFAGTIFLAREGNAVPRELTPDVVARLMEKPSRDIITAGRANERVPAHSPIPKLFLAALNGAADPSKHGVISAAEINIYLRSQLLNLRGVNLTPQQGRLLDPNFAEGEFLFRVPNSVNSADLAAQAWAAIQDTTSIAMLEQFRTLYAGSIYAPFATARIKELNFQTAVVGPPARATPPPLMPVQPAVVAPPTIPPIVSSPCSGGLTVTLASRSAKALSTAEECGLKAKEAFKECDKCPERIVAPAGSFMMGSSEKRDGTNFEGPQHRVTFGGQFAVGTFAVTFDEWEACVADGGCNGYRPEDEGWGRGRRPVINVSWNHAKAYAAWLSRKTEKTYRLLSEAEREYVTRAGTTTPFWWGSSISTQQANYFSGSWGSGRTVPVAHHYRKNELVSAAIYAMALRRLSPHYKPFEFNAHNGSLHSELNKRFGMSPPTYLYQASDSLLQMLKDELGRHEIADM